MLLRESFKSFQVKFNVILNQQDATVQNVNVNHSNCVQCSIKALDGYISYFYMTNKRNKRK